jgi:hypothetical protein
VPAADHHETAHSAPAGNNNNNQQSQSRSGTADHGGRASRAGTADGKELAAMGLDGVEKEVLSKEEEEFLKLESIFITELGLHKDQLPTFARPPEPTTT